MLFEALLLNYNHAGHLLRKIRCSRLQHDIRDRRALDRLGRKHERAVPRLPHSCGPSGRKSSQFSSRPNTHDSSRLLDNSSPAANESRQPSCDPQKQDGIDARSCVGNSRGRNQKLQHLYTCCLTQSDVRRKQSDCEFDVAAPSVCAPEQDRVMRLHGLSLSRPSLPKCEKPCPEHQHVPHL